jgi:UDP-N-acetylglucosamine diphosphorylase / glucose-1-phosphate thymidylyltransferase / UDP-N-acetylgalactosamine diphosphorylase / glucosamine-1-phosphate N-acetyltransferase / galactosamine-1-phosphate N-acetyltransferase
MQSRLRRDFLFLYFRKDMKKIVFTEEFCSPENLFPFTLTRQIQDTRVGILTIREKWEYSLGLPSYDKFEEDYKDLDRSVVIDGNINDEDLIYLIHGNVMPAPKLLKRVTRLKHGEFITFPEREGLIYCISKKEVAGPNRIKVSQAIELEEPLYEINYPWDIFKWNAWAIQQDFDLITRGRKSQKLSSTNKVNGKGRVFLEKGAKMEHCLLNTEDGPVYIGKDALVMEGSMIRGPVAIGENAVVKMGTRLYGATSIGPYCTAGGEIKNSVMFGYSNKAHDGYLGDSVIGEWCNMGAGTSNSNIKNNASDVTVWTPAGPVNAGIKCGTFMGDYSRTAINTSINTGTVIGTCANLFGTGLTPKYVPSFSWGSDGLERYELTKAFLDIDNWKRLKHQQLTENERIILRHVFEHH